MAPASRASTRNAASVPVPAPGRIRAHWAEPGRGAVSGGSGALGEGGCLARRLVPAGSASCALRRADASLRPGSRQRADAPLGSPSWADARLGASAPGKTPAPGRADTPHIADTPPGAGAPDRASARSTAGSRWAGARRARTQWRKKRLRAAKPTSSPRPRSRMTTIRTRKGHAQRQDHSPGGGRGRGCSDQGLDRRGQARGA